MSSTDLSETAKRIADAVMRGDYGSVSSDSESDESPSTTKFAGFGLLQNKKRLWMISGVALGIVVLAGAAGGGYYLWKKRQPNNQK